MNQYHQKYCERTCYQDWWDYLDGLLCFPIWEYDKLLKFIKCILRKYSNMNTLFLKRVKMPM